MHNIALEKELAHHVSTFNKTQVLHIESDKIESFLLYIFMNLAENFSRKSKILLLMKDKCNVSF